MPVSRELLQEVALSPDEYELIVRRLGREPSLVELGLFGSLWSEHCGYQHSRPLLAFTQKEMLQFMQHLPGSQYPILP